MNYILNIEDVRDKYPDYEIISQLRPSAQKASFKVRDKAGNILCLKIISPKYQFDRLQREVLALQNIEHENIAKLIEHVLSTKAGEARHHIIEEFIEGYDLDDYIEHEKPDFKKILDIFSGITSGMEVIHRNEVVHRDIKPGNIRVDLGGKPVIIDFGLARHLNMPSLTKTEHGARIGTPKYFSPEQINGTKKDIDYRTDIFCLGIVIYEVIVGEHPFYESEMSVDELYEAILTSNDYLTNEQFGDLPQLTKILLSKMLKKDKIERFQSMEQVNKLIKKCI